MFSVRCPGHGSPVLLGPDHIESLVNGPDGMCLHWRCPCGASGVHVVPRPSRASSRLGLLKAAS